MSIKIFGRPNCQWCDAAKNLLDRKHINYTYIDLIDMPNENRTKVLAESGMKSVPIVKVDNIYIGGYDQLEAYIRGKEENGT